MRFHIRIGIFMLLTCLIHPFHGIGQSHVFARTAAGTVCAADTVVLRWDDDSDNEDGFCIERKAGTTGAFAALDSVGENVTVFSVESPPMRDSCHFRVFAYNSNGNSGYSNVVSFLFSYPIPDPPYNLAAATLSPTRNRLTWILDEDSYIDGLYVERRTGSGSFTRIDTLGITQTWTDSTAMPSTAYSYRVLSYNPSGCSAPSSEVGIQTGPGTSVPRMTGIRRRSDTRLELTWSAIPGAWGYNVYKDDVAFFQPDRVGGTNRAAQNVVDADPSQEGVQWIDEGGANCFYLVTAIGDGESECSNRMGEFTYALTATPATDFNEIAIPLVLPDVDRAQELMNAIPQCNSIARWNSFLQGYEQYVPGLTFTDFSVSAGNPYYVNVSSDASFTLLGEVATPSFDLVTTSMTDFNEIMLTLDKTSITRASELMADIPHCNSVAKWNASIQGYEQYVPGLAFTDFNVRVGYPYYVNVTANGTWPEEAAAKRTERTDADTLAHGLGSAPHIVWGRIMGRAGFLEAETLHVEAFIKDRAYERMTDRNPGCMLRNGFWLVQCRAFPAPWRAGDVLCVDIANPDGRWIGRTETVLSNEPADRGDDMVIPDTDIAPTDFVLGQNYPNPFNPETTLEYLVPERGKVTIAVYNIEGRNVRNLKDEEMEPGRYTVRWTGMDEHGCRSPSGLYVVRLTQNGLSRSRKIVFSK